MNVSGRRKKNTIYTLGHSDLALDKFVKALRRSDIQTLVDIRSIPRSRHVPHFNQDSLKEKLPASGITYHHLKELGGRGRKPAPRSPNTGLTKTWQAYADHMHSHDFERGLTQLLALASLGTVAVFCAEADWKKCHRRLLADMLLVRGFRVVHLVGDQPGLEHVLSAGAEVKKERLIYPAVGEQMRLF